MDIQRNERSWPRAVWVCGAEEVSRREAIARIIRGRYDASGRLQPRHYIKLDGPPALTMPGARSWSRRTTCKTASSLKVLHGGTCSATPRSTRCWPSCGIPR